MEKWGWERNYIGSCFRKAFTESEWVKGNFVLAIVFHLQYFLQGVSKFCPPCRAEMRNVPRKPRIAFSNTIYSESFWRVSCSATGYLRLNEALCKKSSIYFGTILDVFGAITHVTYESAKIFKKRSNLIPMWIYVYFALLSPVLL